ncbi:ExeM/NucH family extracellular endonuclease [Psychrobium sp. 1_MG-2023]|uniref:ExeM/NucH family extracellular endonuclease n=1 Tax=Psychrobium sp. 1_MG-2023 TaxID=3062624 RepID=UPI000C329E02|nr:ExeM/NucH family extracellular endonuclease [Psychrobium sp. 1_MG-2023]MDP2560905.1 ExeM/NucH family extracellular endonuclease [Psychrobium sp. 1_MG-2023]PKF55979.1 endonuclease/exonuclease/phosphatase [Alteromonadales bacterium alter-6D02]
MKLKVLIIISLLMLSVSTIAQAKRIETTTIMALQGSGEFSPFTKPKQKIYQSAQQFKVSGVITHVQPQALGEDLPQGFFLQDVYGDNNPLTSDAIFVVSNNKNIKKGQVVSVTGHVAEHYGWTQFKARKINHTNTSKTLNAVPLVALSSDKNFSQTLERYEGMLVNITEQSDLFVSRSLSFDRQARRVNMSLAHQGITYQPTQHFAPGSSDSHHLNKKNQQRQLIIESHQSQPKGVVSWYLDFAKSNSQGSTDHYIRISDQAVNLTGVVGYSYKQFRLYVTKQATKASFKHLKPRTSAPVIKPATLKVATFNVLNYFNSPFGGDKNPREQSRGAHSLAEFNQQAQKIVAAITALDADIIGLLEIENNGYGKNSAIVDLVTRINATLPPAKHYRFVQHQQQQFIGTGAITSQLIYRPQVVTKQQSRIIEMPQQHAPRSGKESGKNFMRDALTVTFNTLTTQRQLTVSVNHFKSKGSACWEDAALQHFKDPDLQASCEHFRVSAAYHLGKSLEKISGHKLIIGDLNAYAQEDPLAILTKRKSTSSPRKITAARDTYIGGNKKSGKPLHGIKGKVIEQSFGYLNTVAMFHPQAYGYSFSNHVGTLDYILASPSLQSFIVDATEWNINAAESSLLEYARKHTGNRTKFNDPYRSSDHDPVIISLNL